jgi:hypothetical protein
MAHDAIQKLTTLPAAVQDILTVARSTPEVSPETYTALNTRVDTALQAADTLVGDYASARKVVETLRPLVTNLSDREAIKEKVLIAILKHTEVIGKLDKGAAEQNLYFVANNTRPGSGSDKESARIFGEYADGTELKTIGAFRMAVGASQSVHEASALHATAVAKAVEKYNGLDHNGWPVAQEELREVLAGHPFHRQPTHALAEALQELARFDSPPAEEISSPAVPPIWAAAAEAESHLDRQNARRLIPIQTTL